MATDYENEDEQVFDEDPERSTFVNGRLTRVKTRIDNIMGEEDKSLVKFSVELCGLMSEMCYWESQKKGLRESQKQHWMRSMSEFEKRKTAASKELKLDLLRELQKDMENERAAAGKLRALAG